MTAIAQPTTYDKSLPLAWATPMGLATEAQRKRAAQAKLASVDAAKGAAAHAGSGRRRGTS